VDPRVSEFPQYEPTRRIRRRGGPTVRRGRFPDRGVCRGLRRFVAENSSLPTAESWTRAAMRPSEKTIRRRFGSFREAMQRAALT